MNTDHFKISNSVISGLAIGALTIVLNTVLKFVCGSDDDGHIAEYLLHQLGIKAELENVTEAFRKLKFWYQKSMFSKKQNFGKNQNSVRKTKLSTK